VNIIRFHMNQVDIPQHKLQVQNISNEN